MDPRRLMAFLDTRPEGLYRIKGFVDFGADDPRNRYTVHAVGRFLRFYPEPWGRERERLTQLVLIGSGIDAPALHRRLAECVTPAPGATPDERAMWGVLRYVPEPPQEHQENQEDQEHEELLEPEELHEREELLEPDGPGNSMNPRNRPLVDARPRRYDAGPATTATGETQRCARAVAARVGLGKLGRGAVGLGRAGRGRARPGEQQLVLTLQEALAAHPTGRPALARILVERRQLRRHRRVAEQRALRTGHREHRASPRGRPP